MNSVARQVISELQLEPLRGEGGFFRQTWRSATASNILFLITSEEFSALHRLAQDEMWHFHSGDCVEHVQLDERDGTARVARLGAEVLRGDVPQVLVLAGVWQGARLAPANTGHGWALLGCTVSPPWDEGGFELAAREVLRVSFPAQAAWIEALTR